MCGRFTLRTPMSVLMRDLEFELATPVEFLPRYNICPTQNVVVIVKRGSQRQLDYMKWGLIPSWAKEAKIASSLLNARSETVATKPSFRSAFKSRRCLIPADGYYEWRREGKAKQPYLFEVDGGRPFAIAGLWETWRGPTGDDAPLHTCTILTTEANDLAREIHDRMPVIVHPADYDTWLDPATSPALLQPLLRPYEAESMSTSPVEKIESP